MVLRKSRASMMGPKILKVHEKLMVPMMVSMSMKEHEMTKGLTLEKKMETLTMKSSPPIRCQAAQELN